jgi:hypothetical protein
MLRKQVTWDVCYVNKSHGMYMLCKQVTWMYMLRKQVTWGVYVM